MGETSERDATRDEVIAWAREHARDGFWHKGLMKFPPPEGWAWVGDRAPFRLCHVAFCNPETWCDVHEYDLGKASP